MGDRERGSGTGGPAAAERLIQTDVGGGAVGSGGEQAVLQRQQRALGIEHVEEVDLAGLITLAREFVRLAGELGGLFQGGEAFRGASAGDEGVLGIGKRREHCLPVVQHGLFLAGAGGFDVRLDAPGVEDRRSDVGGDAGGGAFRIKQLAAGDGVQPQ